MNSNTSSEGCGMTPTTSAPSSTSSSSAKANECVELKNLKYKSMMLKNNQKRGDSAMQLLHNTSATDSVSNVEKYLEHERMHKTNELWGKLDKTVKLSKLNAFAQKYIKENNLPESETGALVSFLTTCIDHKKIVKTKDVVYDKTTGTIVSIPILAHVNLNPNSAILTSSSSIVSPSISTPSIGTPSIGSSSIGTPSIGTPSIGTPSIVKFTLRRCEKRPSTLKSLSHGHGHNKATAAVHEMAR